MKRQRDEFTERAESEAWAKIPKRPQNKPEAATDFDTAQIYAPDEGVDADAVAHAPTRGEIESALRGLGFNDNERVVVLACSDNLSGNHPTMAAIASETKLHRHTVKNILKRPQVREALQRLNRGEPLATPVTGTPPTTDSGLELHWLDDHARNEIERLSHRAGREVLRGWMRKLGVAPTGPRRAWAGTKITKQHSAGALVELVKCYPAILLQPEGRLLLEGLVDLFEAAKHGNPARRVPGLLPEGKGKRVLRAAQAALAGLAKPLPGEALDYPPESLARLLDLFRERVTQLQAEYGATLGELVAVRLANIREAHAVELHDFNKCRLQSLLTGEPLGVAAGLAEKATGVTAETFKRARCKCLTPYQRRAEKTRKP